LCVDHKEKSARPAEWRASSDDHVGVQLGPD